jgi:Na+/proline symporter
MNHMPVIAQIFFFGALISAIMSTASATLLAPSTTFVENILKNIIGKQDDKKALLTMRISLFVFTACVLTYAIVMEGTPIYELVSGAYQFPLVGAFIPLVCGLYWKKATTQGAIYSITLGLAAWLTFMLTPLGEQFPQQFAGLIGAIVGMVAGSLLPQAIKSPPKHHYET